MFFSKSKPSRGSERRAYRAVKGSAHRRSVKRKTGFTGKQLRKALTYHRNSR